MAIRKWNAPKLSPDDRAELERLRGENAEMAERLRQIDSMRELEVKIENGELTARERSEFTRALAMTAAEVFVKEGGVNYLSMTFMPRGPAYPPEFGNMAVTFQRVNGLTPTMVIADLRSFWNSRLKRVRPDQVRDRGVYLCLLSRSGLDKYMGVGVDVNRITPWFLAYAHVPAPGRLPGDPLYLGAAGFDGASSGSFSCFEVDARADPDSLAEIYELREPGAPDPALVPKELTRYVFTMDVDYLEAQTVLHRLRRAGNPYVVEKGTVATLIRQYHPTGYRWHVAPFGHPVTGLSFADDGGEIPDWIRPEGGAYDPVIPNKPPAAAAAPQVLCSALVKSFAVGDPAAHEAAGPCCDRAGEYNGYGSDGPRAFRCPKGCPCHD